MDTVSGQGANGREAALIRFGGLAGLLTFGLHILINYALIELPPQSGELKTYFSEHGSATVIGHGLRYPAFFCLAFFAVGMYLLTGRGKTLAGNGWGIVGLLGATAQITIGIISNTFQTVALLNLANPSGQSEHFTLLWNLGRVLFRVEPMLAGLMFACFSIAGWQSATLPRWLAVPGLLCAALSLIVAVFISWTMTDRSGPQLLLWARTLLGMVWFLSACVLMVRRASA